MPSLTILFTLSLTALAFPVKDVVLLCAYKQMVWVDAGTVVAGVADIETIWNGALVQLIGYSVCSHGLSSVPSYSISILIPVGSPDKAFALTNNLGIERLREEDHDAPPSHDFRGTYQI